jgi:hypothetical protein
MDSLPEDAGAGPAAVLSRFRRDFHACLSARADELSELADAMLCADGPVRDLAGLSLAPEHRRGHGALYDAVNHGRIDVARLRRSLAGLPLPRSADGRLMLAVDVSSWLRPEATSPGGPLRRCRLPRGFQKCLIDPLLGRVAPVSGPPATGVPDARSR